jgi:CRISPR/Cas system-associated protein Csm6
MSNQHTNFKQASAKKDPLGRVSKQIEYVAKSAKNDPVETERREKEIRQQINGIRKLAAKRPTREAAELNYQAARLLDRLDAALGHSLHTMGVAA